MHLLAYRVLLALSRQEQQKKMDVNIPMYNSESLIIPAAIFSHFQLKF